MARSSFAPSLSRVLVNRHSNAASGRNWACTILLNDHRSSDQQDRFSAERRLLVVLLKQMTLRHHLLSITDVRLHRGSPEMGTRESAFRLIKTTCWPLKATLRTTCEAVSAGDYANCLGGRAHKGGRYLRPPRNSMRELRYLHAET